MKKTLSFFIAISIFASLLITTPVFAADTISSTEYVVLDLTNHVVGGTNIQTYSAAAFPSDHSTNPRNTVFLAKYSVANIGYVENAVFNIKAYIAASTVQTYEIYCVDNAWTKAGLTSDPSTFEFTPTANNLVGSARPSNQAWVTDTVTLDLDKLKKNATNDGTVSLLLRINKDAWTGAAQGWNVISPSETTLGVTYDTQPAEFSMVTNNKVSPSSVTAVKSDAMTTPVTDNLFDLTGNTLGYVFETFNLSGTTLENIDKVTLNISGYWDTTSGVSLYNVVTPWNSTDGTYTADALPIATGATKSGLRAVSLDITDYIKNLTNATNIELMLKSTTSTTKQSLVYVKAPYSPELNITYKKAISTISDIQESGTLLATRFVCEGTAGAPINAVPILALYDGNELVASQIGEETTLSGTAQKLSAQVDIDASKLTNQYTAKLFIWIVYHLLILF